MGSIKFKFDQEKAIEVILYIAQRVPEPTYMRILKLMYLADKNSLKEYGRFISSDHYVAMENGPVPSKSYDLIKISKTADVFGFAVNEDFEVLPSRSANEGELSESDISVLDSIIAQYGSLPIRKLRDKTHDQAYHQVWDETSERKSIPIPTETIAGMFESADELIDYITHPHD